MLEEDVLSHLANSLEPPAVIFRRIVLSKVPRLDPDHPDALISRALIVCASICILLLVDSLDGNDNTGMCSSRFCRKKLVSREMADCSFPAKEETNSVAASSPVMTASDGAAGRGVGWVSFRGVWGA